MKLCKKYAWRHEYTFICHNCITKDLNMHKLTILFDNLILKFLEMECYLGKTANIICSTNCKNNFLYVKWMKIISKLVKTFKLEIEFKCSINF